MYFFSIKKTHKNVGPRASINIYIFRNSMHYTKFFIRNFHVADVTSNQKLQSSRSNETRNSTQQIKKKQNVLRSKEKGIGNVLAAVNSKINSINSEYKQSIFSSSTIKNNQYNLYAPRKKIQPISD